MKLEPKTEALVFLAVKELGEGTREEIMTHLKAENIELDDQTLLRYLHKFKARRIFTIRTRSGIEVWAVADIPPWYVSGMMDIVNMSANKDLKLEIDALNERVKREGVRMVQPMSPWNSFKSVELTFETIDPLLGGWLTQNDRELAFPRRNGELIIPPNWIHGWIRDNQALMECAALQYHVAIGTGIFIGKPETTSYKLKVKTGVTAFEAVPAGAKFKVTMRIPLKGSKIKDLKDVQAFFGLLAEAPIRGLGANSRAFGGKVQLLEMKELA